MLIVKGSNFILGYFFGVSFNSELLKEPGIYDMWSKECSYTFGSVVRSVGRVWCSEKLRKFQAFCEVSLECDRYFVYWLKPYQRGSREFWETG